MRLYADENFPHPAARELQTLGHDVLTARDAGRANRSVSDPEVLQSAFEEERVVLTADRRHYKDLHDRGRPHSGIVAHRFDRDNVGLARRIDAALRDPQATRRFFVFVDLDGFTFAPSIHSDPIP